MPIADSSIDLVVTSPPYLNAIDYIRCSKFSLVWMGYSIEKLAYVRRLSVGSETGTDPAGDVQIRAILKSLKLEKLPRRKMGIVATYIQDMRSALAEVHRVLVPGGKAVYVVGENTISGKYIENGKILSLLAQSLGFRIAGYSRRKLPPNRRYLPPPTTTGGETLDSRMRAEIILEFRKRAASSNRKPS
jgi:DNA modification methylase